MVDKKLKMFEFRGFSTKNEKIMIKCYADARIRTYDQSRGPTSALPTDLRRSLGFKAGNYHSYMCLKAEPAKFKHHK